MSDKYITIDRTFFQCWLKVSWLVVLGLALGAACRVLMLKAEPRVFVSLAKISLNSKSDVGRPAPETDFDSLIEIKRAVTQWLESTEMQERALQRLETQSGLKGKALEHRVRGLRVEVPNRPDLTILSVCGFGEDRQTTRLFLDSVLEEFTYSVDSAALRSTAFANVKFGIAERASGAVEDVRDFAFSGFIYGTFGGLFGCAFSLMLAVWIFETRPQGIVRDQEPRAISRGREESFHRTSSRVSGLVVIGMSLGASIQLFLLSDVDSRHFYSVKLQPEHLTDDATGRSPREEIADTIAMAARTLASNDLAIRAQGRIRLMSRHAEIESVQINALPGIDPATLEVRAYGHERKPTLMFLEVLLSEFDHDQESNRVRLVTTGPPTWTTVKPPDKTFPVIIGALVGGVAGFGCALLIAVLIRAAVPRMKA